MKLASIEQLNETDKAIAVLREAWLDAAPDKKQKWMDRIDALLGDRFALTSVTSEEGASE